MRRTVLAILVLLSTNALAALPRCDVAGLPELTINSGETIFLELDPALATSYTVIASTPGPCVGSPTHCGARNAEAFIIDPQEDGAFAFFFAPRTSEERIFRISVLGTSTAAGDTVLRCETQADLTLLPHAPLAAIADRVVVPAGAAIGANGSVFRTALRLTGFGSGRIYFRKAGSFHGDGRDPSIGYDLGLIPFSGIPKTLFFEDIAAELGVTGLGMLDVIPDEIEEDPRGGYVAPFVESWIYNETEEGRNGSVIGAIPPAILARGTLHMIVPDDYPDGSRMNVGIRTFEQPARFILGVMDAELDSIIVFNDFEMPEHTYSQVSLDSLVPADLIVLEPGDILILLEENEDAPVAAYYSVTNNGSNDTEVFYEPRHWDPDRLRDVILRLHDWY